jgi:putative sterol carrier protein
MQRIGERSTPRQLAQILDGKTDDQIETAIAELGVDVVLDKVFAYVVGRFVPAKTNGVRPAIVQWRLETPHGIRTYQVTIRDGVCSVSRSQGQDGVTVTFAGRLALFLRLISGLGNGLEAASRGQLEIAGDQTVAILHQSWFDFGQDQTVANISTPRDLARLIEGRSNEEIDVGIAAIGVDFALEQMFRGIVDRFLPDKGPRKRTVAEFVIRTVDGPRTYQIVASPTGISFARDATEKADFGLTADLADLIRMGAGKLDALTAFACGKLRLRGNLLIAASFPGWFDFSG